MIDFNKTRQYTLSIRLSTDGFCFAVHNPEAANEYAYQPYRIDPLKPMASNLKAAVEEIQMLKHGYGAVNIILADTNYTLVPKEYYAEQYDKELYEYNISSPITNSIVMHNVVAEEQVVVLFAIEKQLHKYITTQYPKAKIYAAISPLINFGAEKSETTTQRYSMAYIHKHQMSYLSFDNGTPTLANTFAYKDTPDALFFLLNCWTTLGLSQTDDTIHIAGQPRHSKALAKELANFIQHIHIIHPAEEFHSTELARIDDMPFDLQALIACE